MVTAFPACDSCRTSIKESCTTEVTGGGVGWNHVIPCPTPQLLGYVCV